MGLTYSKETTVEKDKALKADVYKVAKALLIEIAEHAKTGSISENSVLNELDDDVFKDLKPGSGLELGRKVIQSLIDDGTLLHVLQVLGPSDSSDNENDSKPPPSAKKARNALTSPRSETKRKREAKVKDTPKIKDIVLDPWESMCSYQGVELSFSNVTLINTRLAESWMEYEDMCEKEPDRKTFRQHIILTLRDQRLPSKVIRYGVVAGLFQRYNVVGPEPDGLDQELYKSLLDRKAQVWKTMVQQVKSIFVAQDDRVKFEIVKEGTQIGSLQVK